MTRTPAILGPEYDAAARLPLGLHMEREKRNMVRAQLERAEKVGDEEMARLMWWELGLIDLILAPGEGVSPCRGGTYEQYAAFYHIIPDTVAYARDRAGETRDVLLELRYLEFVLLRSGATGRAWVELRREILSSYREYIDGCRRGAQDDADGRPGVYHAGAYIHQALRRVAQLLALRGLVPPDDMPEWAAWLVGLAEDPRSFPEEDPDWVEQQRHRWITDYFEHLTALPPDAVSAMLRTKALDLLADAAAYYAATPLNDHFEHRVAEVEANLRKYWGEKGTHEQLIRRKFEATLRRAEFHKGTGSGLLTAEFFRQARTLVEQHRQYFTDADVRTLERAEQEALEQAVEAGDFKAVGFSIEIPGGLMDYVRDTPEATAQAIVEAAVRSVPDRAKLGDDVLEANTRAPLQAIIQRKVVGKGKVTGQTTGEEGNVQLEIESRAMLQTRFVGTAAANAVREAAASVALTPEHLLAPIGRLGLDKGSIEPIQHGCERLISGDFVSATHILVPRIEDALRQYLRAIGVDTTEFVADVGDGTSRTDDASLGSLMRKTLPDGRRVRQYLGDDVWDHLDSVLNSQTGLNLRNEFAHGLARPAHCTAEVAGIALMLLYLLAQVAARTEKVDGSQRPVTSEG